MSGATRQAGETLGWALARASETAAEALGQRDPASAPRRSGGAFLVLEAVDLAGKSTQLRALAERLRQRGLKVAEISYPVRLAPLTGPMIESYLAGQLLSKRAGVEMLLAQALFSLNRREAAPVLEALLASHDLVLSSRYQLSGRAYAEGGGVPPEEVTLLQAALEQGLRQPDLTLILDLDPAALVARPRSIGRDRHEVNPILQAGVRTAFQRALGERVWLIDASGEPEQVTLTILAAYERARQRGWLP
jgi:dTMP kinase